MGAKKIRIKLQEEGIVASPKRISKLMREMGLACVSTRARTRVYRRPNNDTSLQNRLNQKFTQEAPNLVWVTDITYVKINATTTYYVCAVIDLFSRKVVSCLASKKIDVNFVAKTFMAAYKSRGEPTSLMLHSDRGIQFVAFTFMRILRKLGVRQSFSNTGYPYDNAVVEAFFSAMKKEEIYQNQCTSFEQLRKTVADYVEYYNEVRPHQTLGYKTPNQVEAIYAEQANKLSDIA